MPDRACQAPDDTELVERVRAGDADAFGLLYDRYHVAIYRYVYYHVAHRQDAEDLTATVFERALQSLPHFRGSNCRFSTWLYRIAHNAVVDYHRLQRTRRALSLEEAHEYVGHDSTDSDRAVDSLDLSDALAVLPQEQRELLVLRFVDGLGHDEVAKVLGKNEGACRVGQHRALRALARILGGGK